MTEKLIFVANHGLMKHIVIINRDIKPQLKMLGLLLIN